MKKVIDRVCFTISLGLGVALAVFFCKISPFPMADNIMSSIVGLIFLGIAMYFTFLKEGETAVTEPKKKEGLQTWPAKELPADDADDADLKRCEKCGGYLNIFMTMTDQGVVYGHSPCRNCDETKR